MYQGYLQEKIFVVIWCLFKKCSAVENLIRSYKKTFAIFFQTKFSCSECNRKKLHRKGKCRFRFETNIISQLKLYFLENWHRLYFQAAYCHANILILKLGNFMIFAMKSIYMQSQNSLFLAELEFKNSNAGGK